MIEGKPESVPSHGRGEATVCCGVKRRPDIREVEVEVIAGAAEGNGLSDAAVPREPAPAVSAHSLDPSTPNHDVRAMIDERRLEDRPPWPAPVPVRETNLATGAASETLCEIKFWRGYFMGHSRASLPTAIRSQRWLGRRISVIAAPTSLSAPARRCRLKSTPGRAPAGRLGARASRQCVVRGRPRPACIGLAGTATELAVALPS